MNTMPISNSPKAILFAILAAALYGISSPISKILLQEVPPTLMAAFLYLGAGFGMLAVNLAERIRHKKIEEAKMTPKEIPYILGMIILDIAAPVLLMFGLSLTTAANAALLNNFEIVATSLIALFVFKESIGKRMGLAILLITTSSFILTVQDYTSFSFSMGSVFILLACICWGFENNCTRMLSMKDPRQIVVIKGLGSGTGSLLIAVIGRQFCNNILLLVFTMLLGFIAYGLSIYCYILAQRDLGAARTSSYYATAPFIGVVISWLVFHDRLSVHFIIALGIMLTGAYFAVTEMHKHLHVHEVLIHEHKHSHNDNHHNHVHEDDFTGEHSHVHVHEEVEHSHVHTPDIHHNHMHPKDLFRS